MADHFEAARHILQDFAHSRNRRLWNNAEATIASATAFLHAAAVLILVRRLARSE
jgi:hypothetical protein